MKIRVGFVSNSSSSSFVCDVCGNSTSGWDMSLYEAGMVECENGHTSCCLVDNDHIETGYEVRINFTDALMFLKDVGATKERIFEYTGGLFREYHKEESEKLSEIMDKETGWFEELLEFAEEFGDFDGEIQYNVPKELCPICTMETIDPKMLLKFVTKHNPDILEKIKSMSYSEFKADLE